MKLIRKISLYVIAIVCVLSLASCSSKRNTKVPYGTLNEDVYAQLGNNKVTNKQLYDLTKAKGYNDALRFIKESLFENELLEVSYENNAKDKKAIDEYVASAVYSTNDAEELSKKTSEEIEIAKKKYIDNNINCGYEISEDNLNFNINEDEVSFSNLPQGLIDYYSLNVAMTNASIDKLTELADQEYIEKDGKMVKNSDFIEESSIKNRYDSSYKYYGETTAILIRFQTARDASTTINKIESEFGQLNDTNKLDFFVRLYNYYYSHREPLQIKDNSLVTNDYTLFKTNDDDKDIASISTQFETFYNDELEDGGYTAIPRSINDQYIMVLRINTKYKTGLNEVVEYDNLEEKLGADSTKAIKDQLKKDIIKSKATETYAEGLFSNRIKDADIKIYDPFIESKFITSYNSTDYYTPVKTFDNNNVIVINYNNKDYTLSVADFSTTLQNKYGMDTAVNQLKYNWILDNYSDKLDSDDIETYEKTLKDSISNFKSNKNTSYPKNVGLSTFLLGTYGYMTKDEVLNYYFKAKGLETKIKKDYVNLDYINSDNTLNEEKLTIFKNFLQFTSKNFETSFSIDINHFLISVDDNLDGTLDDPKEFRDNLSEEEKVKFDSAVLELSKAIISEVNFIHTSKEKALQYIVKAFYQNEELHSAGYEGKTWDEFRLPYNFALKTEDLGEVNQNSVSNFVPEFADYVEKVYSYLNENSIQIKTDESAFIYDLNKNNELDFAEICLTEYGYHVLVVNDYEKPTAPYFSKDDDKSGDFSNIKVILDEKDTDDKNDDVYVYTNIYNETKTNASLNQLFVYFFEYQNGGVNSFDSNTKSALSKIFDSVITKYTSDNFQDWLILNKMGSIEFTNSEDSRKYTLLKDSYKNKFYEYKDNGTYLGWFDLNW